MSTATVTVFVTVTVILTLTGRSRFHARNSVVLGQRKAIPNLQQIAKRLGLRVRVLAR